MLRTILAVVGGLATWTVVATACNLVMRRAWPGYAEVEAAMGFTPAMMLARLLLGALASLGAGLVGAWISRGQRRAVVALTVVLLAVFIPVHYRLWEKFPLWYHLAFLLSLAVLPALGSTLMSFNSGSGKPQGVSNEP